LEKLEANDRTKGSTSNSLFDELPLFSATPVAQVKAIKPSAADVFLEEITPDELTPREALDILYKLKNLS
jgi:DNA mismatch repair protein MutS